MNVLINHCWCSDSIWGGNYDCRVIVSINRIPKGKTYYDPPELDWINLVEKRVLGDRSIDNCNWTISLKPEVLLWLTENVANRKGEKGWAIGTDEYNSNDRLQLNVFFQSYRDAAKFIKRWSSYGKPVDYLNYFKDIRRELDFKSNRLKSVPRWA